jgi:voltage-gated potassium channel
MTERPANLFARLRRNLAARRAFEFVSQAVIVVWLIAFSLETLPHLTTAQRETLKAIEWIVAVFFTAEYLIRLLVAKHRLKFIFSFFGIVDLIAILPFYLSFFHELSAIRALRLMRIARLLKLARYNRALHRLYQAWMLAWEEFVMFVFLALILIYIAAAGIYHFEHEAQPDKFTSIFDSLWWAICTLTTVGYGDVYPITAGGRIFTCMVLLIGLGIVAVPTGIIASSLTVVREHEHETSPVSSEGNPPVD